MQRCMRMLKLSERRYYLKLKFEAWKHEFSMIKSEEKLILLYRVILRIFPLLGISGSFNYWKDQKKKNLYSMFLVLDSLYAACKRYDFYLDPRSTYNAAINASSYEIEESATFGAANAIAVVGDFVAHYLRKDSSYLKTANLINVFDEFFYCAILAIEEAQKILDVDLYLIDTKDRRLSVLIQSDFKHLKRKNGYEDLLNIPLWDSKPGYIEIAEKKFKTALISSEMKFDYWYEIYEQHILNNLKLDQLDKRLTIPEEVKIVGVEFITDYLLKLSGRTTRLNEVRIIFMGDGGAGKTSLIRRLFNEEMSDQEESTTEIKIREHLFEKSGITAHFWDFGGQVMLHATHQLFLRERCVYVIVLDGRKEEKPEYWLDHVKMYGNNSPVFIIKNKCDEGCSKDVQFNMLKDNYDNIVGNYSLSCKNTNKWSETIAEFAYNLDKFIKEKSEDNVFNPFIPESFSKIKEKLQQIKNEVTNNEVKSIITYDTYREICNEHGISDDDELQHLMGFFDSLGVLLRFENHNEHVLNPDWLSVAAYRIVRSEKIKNNNGILSFSDLEDILTRKADDLFEYHKTKHKFILEVLSSFELLYFLKNDNFNEINALVPSLLPGDQIKNLDKLFDRSRKKLIHFVYKFNFLPASVMTRFIVKMHEDIDLKFLWRHGVILTDSCNNNNQALVIEDKAKMKISIWVHGDDARGYFCSIRKVLLQILNTSFTTTYQERDEYYQELVPLGKNKRGVDEYINYEELLQKEQDNEEFFTVSMIRIADKSNPSGSKPKKFQVKNLLNGYSSPEQRIEEANSITNIYQGVGTVNNGTTKVKHVGIEFSGDNQNPSFENASTNNVSTNGGNPTINIKNKKNGSSDKKVQFWTVAGVVIAFIALIFTVMTSFD